MDPVFFKPVVPTAFGLLVCMLLFSRRLYLERGKRRRRINYLLVFLDSATAYILALVIAQNRIFEVPYPDIFRHGFAAGELHVALLFAVYHMSRETIGKFIRK